MTEEIRTTTWCVVSSLARTLSKSFEVVPELGPRGACDRCLEEQRGAL